MTHNKTQRKTPKNKEIVRGRRFLSDKEEDVNGGLFVSAAFRTGSKENPWIDLVQVKPLLDQSSSPHQRAESSVNHG
ncbi:hypothetical protein JOB18_021674 [Solea senegalensis]|uniref:Uncharacterized protein n=1 Tax=Solea senegalensis TaxID=28829 RepID=A0AAV6R6E8_SOLSE|nr:hypothetical protein JOB18_021674 [Solea senegalensis]